MESIMKKMNVKKCAAALLGIFALGGGFAVWSAGTSPVAARYGGWDDGWHRRGDRSNYGEHYNRQPGENYPDGSGRWGWHNRHWRGGDVQPGGWIPDKKDYEAISAEIAKDYELDEKEILAAFKEKRNFWDIMDAAVVAKASTQPFANVIRFKTAENSWGDVYAAMRVSPEMMRAAEDDVMINRMAARLAMDKTQLKGLLEDGYRLRDIICASGIAKLSNTGVKEILQEKKVNNRWEDVARARNIDRETFWRAVQDMDGFGGGFHGRGYHGGSHCPMY